MSAPTTRALAVDLLQSSGLEATANQTGLVTSKNDISAIAGDVIGAVLGLSGVVIVCLLIYAGFIWMTAQGDDSRVKQAKGIIKNAVIGAIIMFSAYAITNAIANVIGEAGLG